MGCVAGKEHPCLQHKLQLSPLVLLQENGMLATQHQARERGAHMSVSQLLDIMLCKPLMSFVVLLQEDGSYALEDEAGSVAIDLSGARSAAGLVTGQ